MNIFQREDIPRHGAPLSALKEFCKKHQIDVPQKFGKKRLIVKDYREAIKKYLEKSDLKYKAENIMRHYGIECLRLPAFHPELSPLGNL